MFFLLTSSLVQSSMTLSQCNIFYSWLSSEAILRPEANAPDGGWHLHSSLVPLSVSAFCVLKHCTEMAWLFLNFFFPIRAILFNVAPSNNRNNCSSPVVGRISRHPREGLAPPAGLWQRNSPRMDGDNSRRGGAGWLLTGVLLLPWITIETLKSICCKNPQVLHRLPPIPTKF